MFEEVSKLAISPLFIVVTILCILHLIILRKESGCLTVIGRIFSIIYIAIYVLARSFYFVR
jgi:hypothetical protein